MILQLILRVKEATAVKVTIFLDLKDHYFLFLNNFSKTQANGSKGANYKIHLQLICGETLVYLPSSYQRDSAVNECNFSIKLITASGPSQSISREGSH